MISPYPWPSDIDRELHALESTPMTELGHWIRQKKSHQQTIHLTLALASARWIDHHGPFIGHGTFNGGPILRAASILTPPYQNLALLQTASYVVDLLHHPNYGPYTLMAMDPLIPPLPKDPCQSLLESIESGENVLRAEHQLVGLLQIESMDVVLQLLLEAALRQFAENEHRLLIVHRAAQLMDDTEGWTWGEPLLRAAIQYLASRPHPHVPDEVSQLSALELSRSWFPETRDIEFLVRALVDADYGTEPTLILAEANKGRGREPLGEAMSLAGAEILAQSDFDAHAVTGIHAVADLVRDPLLPHHLHALALGVMLLGSRTRRQKAQRSRWSRAETPLPRKATPADVREAVASDASGDTAFGVVGAHIRDGADPTAVAATLTEIALMSAGPFEAIHNVKMLWGQLLETQRSHYPNLAWRHLAAGAATVARTANLDDAAPILEVWRASGLTSMGT